MPYEITQCYLPPGRGDCPPLLQPKLVLDLATPERCKAELTWVVVISQDSLPAKYGHLSQKYNFTKHMQVKIPT